MQILTTIQQTIIRIFLCAEAEVSSTEIQKECAISKKTITVEIREANDYLLYHGAYIETLKGIGYCLRIDDLKKFNDFKLQFLHNINRNHYLYLDKNYLTYLILFEFMLSDRYITIDELSEKLHYSRNMISNSLKDVKIILEEFNCKLESKPNYGLKINASEWSKRIYIIFLDKIATRMSTINIKDNNSYDKTIIKKTYHSNIIELIINEELRQFNVNIPLCHLIKINYYIVVSQIRNDFYSELDIDDSYTKKIKRTIYLRVSQSIAKELEEQGISLQEKDIIALAILISCYANRDIQKSDLHTLYKHDVCETLEIIQYLIQRYKGVEKSFDDDFISEFTNFLIGLKERIFYNIPNDDEIGFQAKNTGGFTTDICRDFADFFYNKYKIILKEAELLNAYYIFSSSLIRNNYNRAIYSVALVSRLGMNFARNIAERIHQQYKDLILRVDVFEFTTIDSLELNNYDLLMTDIEQKRYNFVSIPIIKLDFFREPQESHLFIEYLSLDYTNKLKGILDDSSLIHNKNFKSKKEIFSFIASRYIIKDVKKEFINDCFQKDTYISFERCNRIVLIPTSSKYFNSNQIKIIFNKNLIKWDNEMVQIFILYNRDNLKYKDMKVINSTITTLLQFNTTIIQEISQMNGDTLIKYIVDKVYGNSIQ